MVLRGKAHAEWKIMKSGERRTVKDDQYLLDDKAVIWGKGDKNHLVVPATISNLSVQISTKMTAPFPFCLGEFTNFRLNFICRRRHFRALSSQKPERSGITSR